MAGSDWEEVHAEVMARGRRRLAAPTPEQLVSYSRGELSEEEAERVREALAYYPDLAVVLSEEDNEERAEILSETELTADWNRLQQAVRPAASFPHKTSARTWQFAVAASWLIIAALGAYALYLRSEILQPRENIDRIVLLEGGTRGPASLTPVTVQPATRYIVFVLTTENGVSASRFRVEIRSLDANPPRVIWRSSITRASDGTFLLEVPRTFFKSNAYDVQLYAERDAKPIASYNFWLAQ